MRWWPWQRREPEKRSTAQGYTASLTAAFEGAAVAGTETAPIATAALESASGLYARCMAAAVVKGDRNVQAALTPPVLALIARNLIRRGEDHHLIRVRGGRLMLLPQGFTYAHGNSADPATWHYSSTEYGPTESVHRTVPAASMLHCRYSVDASRPWLGVPPWSWASSTGAAIAALERLIANESAAPHGHVLAVPEAPTVSDDSDEGPLDGFRRDLGSAKGRTLVAERPGNWQSQPPGGATGANRFETTTFGMERALLDPLRTATGRDVLAACGCPPTLFTANSDGTAQREAFRRFMHSSLNPVARLIEAECREKLDAPGLTLDLSELHASDVAGRARSFKALVGAGVHPEDASANTGVMLSRDVAMPEGGAP